MATATTETTADDGAADFHPGLAPDTFENADQENEENDDADPSETVAAAPRKRDRSNRIRRKVEAERVRAEARADVAEARSPVNSAPFKAMEHQEHVAIRDWLESIAAGQPELKIGVERVKPQDFEGKRIAGHLDSYYERIDEDLLKGKYGSGTYQLKVHVKDPKSGAWRYLKTRTVEIGGGLPKLESAPAAAAAVAPGEDASSRAIDRILDFSLAQANRPQQQAPAGPDMDMLRAITGPMERQIAELAKSNRDKDERLAEAMRTASSTPVRSALEDKMFASLLDGDSSRMTAMRETHASELRQLKENAREDEKRTQERFDREIEYTRRSHDMMITALRDAGSREVESIRTSSNVTKAILEAQVAALQRELTKVESAIEILRSKKDVGPKEMVEQFNSLKKLFGKEDDDEDEKSIVEKIAEHPIGQAIGMKLSGMFAAAEAAGAPAHQAAQQQAGPPVGVVFQLQDGSHAVRRPDGRTVRVRQKPQQPQATVVAADGTVAPTPIILAPDDLAKAVNFLEAAMRNNTAPGDVVSSVKTFMPPKFLVAIRTLGVDGFVDQVAQSHATSPLIDQSGRIFLRRLFRAFTGETEPEPETAPEAAPATE